MAASATDCATSVDDLEWSTREYEIHELQEFGFPLLVRVCEGFYGIWEEQTFSVGDILKIHTSKSLDKVEAEVPGSKEPISIPVEYRGKVRILPLQDKVYQLFREVVEQRPKYIRFKRAVRSGAHQNKDNIVSGAIVTYEGKQKVPEGSYTFEVAVCRVSGERVQFSLDLRGEFEVLPDQTLYTMEDILKRPLPQKIEFVGDTGGLDKGNILPNLDCFRGEFILKRKFKQDVLIASSKVDALDAGKKNNNMILLPVTSTSDIMYNVATNYSAKKDNEVYVKFFGPNLTHDSAYCGYIEYSKKPMIVKNLTIYKPPRPPNHDKNSSDKTWKSPVETVSCSPKEQWTPRPPWPNSDYDNAEDAHDYDYIEDEDINQIRNEFGEQWREKQRNTGRLSMTEDRFGYLLPVPVNKEIDKGETTTPAKHLVPILDRPKAASESKNAKMSNPRLAESDKYDDVFVNTVDPDGISNAGLKIRSQSDGDTKTTTNIRIPPKTLPKPKSSAPAKQTAVVSPTISGSPSTAAVKPLARDVGTEGVSTPSSSSSPANTERLKEGPRPSDQGKPLITPRSFKQKKPLSETKSGVSVETKSDVSVARSDGSVETTSDVSVETKSDVSVEARSHGSVETTSDVSVLVADTTERPKTYVSRTESKIKSYHDVPDTKNLPSLKVGDLAAVLSVYELKRVASLCENNHVDGEVFFEFTDNMWKSEPFCLNEYELLKINKIKAGWKPNR